jgi:programmed cell death 6-interacting protein
MVKVLYVSDDLKAEDETSLFKSIVPDSSAKSMSKYTDMRDAKTRKLFDDVVQLSDEARLRLAEWDLPDLLQNADSADSRVGLPHALQEEVDEVQRKNGMQGLYDSLQTAERRRQTCKALLEKSKKALEDEDREDREARQRFGNSFHRLHSSSANSQLWCVSTPIQS